MLKHVNGALRPTKSILATVLLHHDDDSVNQLITECSPPQGKNKTVLFRIHHLFVNIKTVASRDIFVSGVVNPAGEQPEGASQVLRDEGRQLKSALQGLTNQATQDQILALEQKVDESNTKVQELEREILDLTTSRKVLSEQLQKKKEVFELRVATSGDVFARATADS